VLLSRRPTVGDKRSSNTSQSTYLVYIFSLLLYKAKVNRVYPFIFSVSHKSVFGPSTVHGPKLRSEV
jgi:hypothetical protein